MSATQATATRTEWQIDGAHANLEFAVRHLMISTVKGRFGDISGTVVTADSPEDADIRVTIGAASIDTRQPQRDEHLKSADFFDVARYPTLTFASRRTTAGPDGTLQVLGDLTIRGVTREILLSVTPEGTTRDPWGGERAGFSATGKLNRRDYGLTWNQVLETGGVAVGDEVKISIDLELVKAGASGR
jgi:polyisoprenoid-binding protein YceI